MTAHKFNVGEKVKYDPGQKWQAHLQGSYTIVRQLPSENRDWQYRVKSDRDQHERIVPESRLVSVAATGAAAAAAWMSPAR